MYLQPDRLVRELPRKLSGSAQSECTAQDSRIVPRPFAISLISPGHYLDLIFEVVPPARGTFFWPNPPEGHIPIPCRPHEAALADPVVTDESYCCAQYWSRDCDPGEAMWPAATIARGLELGSIHVRSPWCALNCVSRVIGCLYLDIDTLINRLHERNTFNW